MLLLTADHAFAPKYELLDLSTKLHIAVDGVVKHVFPYDSIGRAVAMKSAFDTLDHYTRDFTDYALRYCTCNVCTDEPSCQYSGKDPFNMNGECIAIK